MTRPALVTGASRGLGFAVAEALAKADPGRPVVAVARTAGGLEALDDRIRAMGGSATLAPMDVTVDAAMQQLCRSIHDRWGGLSLWVHTAIEAPPLSPAPMVAPKDLAKAWAVNVAATARLIGYVAPLLGTDGAAVVPEDDRAGAKHFAAYGATKAAQSALVRSWGEESTAPRIVRFTPRPMPTALRARFFPGEDTSALTPCADEAARLLAAL
ncbi:NADP-dependent 3-hydroxy acid dehydrogenase YdfG [Hasllibacter halocynthiae]|uniref:NADP-dependent 3-hydroxy acid dehydrogenase YdfG n=1 Tax=Hasllibacter halocynthiae TaxID=595589 RepID=A0A2T0X8R0_9RHOB|nr:SDR family oxidoreductase [Hasllibacter halocynthiae]PRY95331.1 NADP-dependent 3-hydroxy acid dehydrogenase YdfG [Hasllibacter halocynthiae]